MKVRFLSKEWAERALRLVETDPEIRDALHGEALSLLVIILQPPQECYGFIYVAFDGTGLADYRVGHDYHTVARGMPAPTFVLSGAYTTFAALQRRELTERKALMSGQLHLTGPMMKALKHRRALEAITGALSSIACET